MQVDWKSVPRSVRGRKKNRNENRSEKNRNEENQKHVKELETSKKAGNTRELRNFVLAPISDAK